MSCKKFKNLNFDRVGLEAQNGRGVLAYWSFGVTEYCFVPSRACAPFLKPLQLLELLELLNRSFCIYQLA